jgi:thiol-disulfide isomerase/thioredoxin
LKTTITAVLVMTLFAAFAALPPAPPPGRVERKSPPAIVFRDESGTSLNLSAFRGKVVLLDFWATWCEPCRKEMPSFDRLQARLGAKGLAVVPVSIDLKGMPAVEEFYREHGIRNLPKYVDDSRDSAKAIGLMGLPGTLAIDRHGREAFRVEGPLNWDGPAVGARVESLLRE